MVQDTTKATITPGNFQEICNQAVLALNLQRCGANAELYELAMTVVTEVHKGICRQLSESYQEQDSLLPNEERIEKS